MNNGYFVISLDYELMWGVRDKKSVAGYGASILEGKDQLLKTTRLLNLYGCDATVAAVGLLFLKNIEDIKRFSPKTLPTYKEKALSPYPFILNTLKANEVEDPYHYGYTLTKALQKEPNIEMATHTFSHYYCLEEGQNMAAFREDMEVAATVAKEESMSLKSIVFPRNQYAREHLELCYELGVETYRGNPTHWIYEAAPGKDQSLIRRMMRLIDTYVNITGHHCFEANYLNENIPMNIPGSRFLKPYSPLLRLLDGWKLSRIKKSMTHAAKKNKGFHLWWHPHNFGSFPEKNLAFLTEILKHYSTLEKEYGFQSITMKDLSFKLNSK